MQKVIESLSYGVLKIAECRLRISDFEFTRCLIFQSTIRNLKSEIDREDNE